MVSGPGTPGVVIRRARKADVSSLAAVMALEVSLQQLAHRWQGHLEDHREMLVAALDGKVAGTVSMGGRPEQPGSMRMFALDVAPAFRRRGVGTALITFVEVEARSRGLRSVHLEVAVDNVRAFRLYARLGYERQGEATINRWWRLADDGRRERVEEITYTLVKKTRRECRR